MGLTASPVSCLGQACETDGCNRAPRRAPATDRSERGLSARPPPGRPAQPGPAPSRAPGASANAPAMPPAAHGENEPFVPPSPRGTRAPAERGSPGAACQLPSRPTLPWARPRSLAGGQYPHYRCQARELEQRAGGAGPGHRWGGVPPGVPGQGCWEGSVPELAGAVEFSRVSDGRSDPRQSPRACWTTGSWSSPALAHGHTRWPHSA